MKVLIPTDFSESARAAFDYAFELYMDFEDVEWLVFAHYKDFLGQTVYKFLGEFHSSRELSTDYSRAFLRKFTKINLSDYQKHSP